MSRFFCSLLFFVGLVGSFAAEKPNIILIMCDDLGWGDVGFNGNKTIRTPHLDAMAKAGLKFNRFYAAAPVCSPTRGSCITGRHPYRYGIPFANSGHMKPEELTLAELLKKQGYSTGHFGKWHLGTLTKTVKDSNRGAARAVPSISRRHRPTASTSVSRPSLRCRRGIRCSSPRATTPTSGGMPSTATSETKPYGTAYWNERGEPVTQNTRGDDSRVIMDRAIPFIRGAAKRDPAVLQRRMVSRAAPAGRRRAETHGDVRRVSEIRTALLRLHHRAG